MTSNATVAALTALWGGLAAAVGPRAAIAAAGVLILATPLLLPSRETADRPGGEIPTRPVGSPS